MEALGKHNIGLSLRKGMVDIVTGYGASYITKAYKDILQPIIPDLTRVWCLSSTLSSSYKVWKCRCQAWHCTVQSHTVVNERHGHQCIAWTVGCLHWTTSGWLAGVHEYAVAVGCTGDRDSAIHGKNGSGKKGNWKNGNRKNGNGRLGYRKIGQR